MSAAEMALATLLSSQHTDFKRLQTTKLEMSSVEGHTDALQKKSIKTCLKQTFWRGVFEWYLSQEKVYLKIKPKSILGVDF